MNTIIITILIVGITLYGFVINIKLIKLVNKTYFADLISTILLILMGLMAISTLMAIYSGGVKEEEGGGGEKSATSEMVIKQLSFEDSVTAYMLELNIAHPDVVIRQARIESGNFQSKIFKENNNMFGFKKAYKRPNTQLDVKNGYATYESWKDCIIDYALYQTYSVKGMNREEYLQFLNKNYAEDPEYLNKIK